MKTSEIRDLIITGSYMIGEDGLREPTHGWKGYANRLEETLVKNNGVLPCVSGCFYLQSEKTPADSGEYEVITNRGRVIKIKYKIFEDNGIWECEYGKHEINESVVAWRFLK